MVVDATEYGDLMPLADVAYRVGNGRFDPDSGSTPNTAACVQAITHTLTLRAAASYADLAPGEDLRGIGAPGDFATIRDYFRRTLRPDGSHGGWSLPWDFATHNSYRGVPDSDGEPFTAADFDAITKTMLNLSNDYPGTLGVSGGYPVAAIEDRDARTREECAARFRTIQLVYYIQLDAALGGVGESWRAFDEVSAFGTAPPCDAIPPAYSRIASLFFPVPYVREARRLVGVETLTASQIRRSGPQRSPYYTHAARTDFVTSLAVGHYFTDLHNCSDASTLETAELGETTADVDHEPGPFQIPFGTFVPARVDGFLVTEKNLSASRLANGAVRLQPISMLTGQAAGSIAALAVERHERIRDVPPALVQQRVLAEASSIALDAFDDVPRTHPAWADIQFVATHRIMRGTGGLGFAPDAPIDRAQLAVVVQRMVHYHVTSPPDWTPLVMFADVPTSSPYYPFIGAMAREGITAGCGTDGSGTRLFCPSGAVTARDMANVVVRAIDHDGGLAPCTTPPFADLPVTDSSCPAIAEVRRLDLVPGCAAGFCPDRALSRAEVATVVARTVAYLASHTESVGACYRTPPAYCPTE